MKKEVPLVLIFIVQSVVYFYLQPLYIDGDVAVYKAAYQSLSLGQTYIDSYSRYNSVLPTQEYGHFLISYIFSCFDVTYEIFAFTLSLLCAFLIYYSLLKAGYQPLIALSLVLTNFYFYILYLPAERLKLSVIFILLAYLSTNRFSKLLFAISSIVTHLQNLITWVVVFIISSKSYKNLPLLFISPVAFFLLFYFSDHLLVKFDAYSDMATQSFDYSSFLRTFVLYVLTMLVAKKTDYIKLSFVFAYIFCCVFLVGEARINMVSYFVFLYFASSNGGFNIPLIMTAIYFGFKTCIFIDSIIEYGHGFSL